MNYSSTEDDDSNTYEEDLISMKELDGVLQKVKNLHRDLHRTGWIECGIYKRRYPSLASITAPL